MRGKQLVVKVPTLVRDYLHPYVEIFEDIIIPIVKDVPIESVDNALVLKVRREIAGFQNLRNSVQHDFLIYYGLMLCCMYLTQEWMELRRTPRNGDKINLINKARLLICLAYQAEAYKLIPFML